MSELYVYTDYEIDVIKVDDEKKNNKDKKDKKDNISNEDNITFKSLKRKISSYLNYENEKSNK